MVTDELRDLHRRLLAEWAMSARGELERAVVDDWRRRLDAALLCLEHDAAAIPPRWPPTAAAAEDAA